MTNTTSETSSASDDAKQAANAVAGDAKSKAVDVQESAKSEVRSVAQDAKDQAADVLGTTRTQLRDQAAEQTKNLSATMRDIGEQLGGMADKSDDPEAQVAKLAKSAADTLGSRAQRLDDGGLDDLVDDVKRFARNRPGAFLLGSIAAGFAVGRLAKHADLQKAGEIVKDEFDTEALKPSDSDSSDQLDSPAGDRVAAVAPGDMTGRWSSPMSDTAGGAHRLETNTDPTQPAQPDMSLGDVVGKLGDDLSGLLTTQVEIAKLEIKEEVGKAAKGAGFLTSGAFAAVVAVFMLSAALAWAIAVPLNEWLGFLIVGLLWATAAAVLALLGKKKLGAVSTTPEQTKAEIDADKRLVQRLP